MMLEQNDFIPFHLPSLGKEEEDAVLRVLRSKWLTTGKETLAFEQEFSSFMEKATTKSITSLAVNSASSGLQLAMEACDVGTGGKILTTPYTFISTATSACHLGGGVVYADLGKDSYNIDPDAMEKKLQEHKDIKALVPVHIAGLPCNMKAINDLSKKYNIPVIEDAAHSFPSKTQDGYAGTLGDIGVFSFYVTKTITTGEGGMICTSNPEYAERIKKMRMHGIDRPVWDRYTSKKASWEYDVVASGYKFNLPDILSAIGRVQLAKAEDLLNRRIKIAQIYNAAFKEYDFLQIPPDGEGNSWHIYVLRIIPEKLSIDRNQFTELLQKEGIGVSMHFIPHFNMSYFKKNFDLKVEDFPNAQKQFSTSFSLPIWPDMTAEMVHRVTKTVISLGKKYYVC